MRRTENRLFILAHQFLFPDRQFINSERWEQRKVSRCRKDWGPVSKVVVVGRTQIVVSAVKDDEIDVEIIVVSQGLGKRISAFAVSAEIQNVDLLVMGRYETLKLRRKILSGAQAKSPGSAASQNRDAFLSRLFSTNDRSAIAPDVYAMFVMQVKVCAKED